MNATQNLQQMIYIDSANQQMKCYQQNVLWRTYVISTGKNGMGEIMGSECTPRGWHKIYSKIGMGAPLNSVFVSRLLTGEIYCNELASNNPGRDWILTRILQLDGMENGRNQGGNVDSLQRYIYIHGTPDTTIMGTPGSRGCIRVNNENIIELAEWVSIGTMVYIV